MDNIIIKKIWEENDLIEIGVSIHSECVEANVNYYVSSKSILDCSQKICAFINNNANKCILNFGKLGEGNVPSFKFNLFQDKTGHALIEAFFELDDGSMPKHQCSCYIRTEIGLLGKLARKFEALVNSSIVTIISLLPEI